MNQNLRNNKKALVNQLFDSNGIHIKRFKLKENNVSMESEIKDEKTRMRLFSEIPKGFSPNVLPDMPLRSLVAMVFRENKIDSAHFTDYIEFLVADKIYAFLCDTDQKKKINFEICNETRSPS